METASSASESFPPNGLDDGSEVDTFSSTSATHHRRRRGDLPSRQAFGREIGHAAAETYLLARLSFKLLSYLGVGYRWITRFLSLTLYAIFLMPGLDLYLPTNSDGLKPVVAFVTGGAWIIGYKAWGCLLGLQLAERDIIVACIDYRNFPQGTISDMIADASRGIAYICENVVEFGGDPDKIYLMGQSAGAHIGACVLVQQAVKESRGDNISWSVSQMNAYFGLSGAYNLPKLVDHFHSRGLYRSIFLSIMEGQNSLEQFSPEMVLQNPCSKNALSLLPRFVLFHGIADYSIPSDSSKSFVETLQKGGVRADLLLYDGKTHTDLFLQASDYLFSNDPLRGGKDELFDDLVALIHADDEEALSRDALAPPRRRFVPEMLLRLGRQLHASTYWRVPWLGLSASTELVVGESLPVLIQLQDLCVLHTWFWINIPAMESKEINLPALSIPEGGSVKVNLCETGYEANEAKSASHFEVEDMLIVEDHANLTDKYLESAQVLKEIDNQEKGLDNENAGVSSTPSMLQSFEIIESSVAVETRTSIESSVHVQNGSLSVQSENGSRNLKKVGARLSSQKIDSCSISGVKRPRMTVDEKQPSVHVIYTSLTKKEKYLTSVNLDRDSKRKLEELMQEWSQWNAHNCSPSNDSSVLQSGEETYFPALRIDLDKSSAVSAQQNLVVYLSAYRRETLSEETIYKVPREEAFWVDGEMKNASSKELIPLDGISVPIYDREYSSALASTDVSSSLDGEKNLDTSRCFNCGSYSHALRECPKPRDNVAVNNARKLHKSSNRNQHSGSRNSTRYYQEPRVKKYDGLMPGALDAETRKLLGLGEFDPPPWLNRMREIGYPPAYLEPDEEDQPSGITIFGDDTTKEEPEDGEILGISYTKPFTKMSVEFPGINSPIPEKADERLWASCYSNSSRSGDRCLPRHIQSYEYLSPGQNHERRRSRDTEDDGPPGCEPGMSPSISNRFHRYVDHDSSYESLSSQVSPSMPWSSTFGRSLSDIGRRSPLAQDNDSSNHGRYGTFSYPSHR
ncbi:hypothetical protein F511_02258 [Dorcoceras hygrometricum]|uniref:protein-S-isoprenylcysteine alpha-carbonyl methylesterase n=1 Tax=Dorcoceras hygrometricum TaxID=472368 RepID=A0A2Z7CF86_9LAMI|nr:hypothetical protein F511_02258 [Dorcoceras hygrometricum]